MKMAIKRWDPMKELLQMQERMTRLFDEIFPRVGRGEIEPFGGWVPAVDIYETPEKVVIEAEVPGVEKDNIKIEYSNGVLTIKGERKLEKEVKEEDYHRLERSYGSFQRSFSIPSTVDPDKINAVYKNGVLKIELPKQEKAKPKEIKIEVK
jgi:HSP20 family protein